MQFRILGPLEVEDDGRLITPPGARARALLALLILHANRPVNAHRLVDEIWGDELPANGVKALQIQISRLRRSLGAERLTTTTGGYALAIAEGELDRDRAVSLVERGEALLEETDGENARAAFDDALALFRGRPLEELSDAGFGFAGPEIALLDDLRLRATEGRIEAELLLGRGAQTVGVIEALLVVHPLRERLHEQRMRALYQAGRQADALEAYQDARRRFDELGLEPGPVLQELERRILNHDPALLGRPSRPARHAGRSRFGRRRMLYAGTGAIVVGLLLVAVAAWSYTRAGPTVPPRALAVLDPEALEFGPIFDLGGVPADVEVGRHAVFAAVPGRGSVVVVDPRTRTAVSVGAPVQRPNRLAAGAQGMWVLDSRGRRVALLGSTRVHPIGVAPGRGPAAALDVFVAAEGALWIAERDTEGVFRVDASTGASREVDNGGPDSFFEGDARRAMVAGAGSVWVSNPVSIFPARDRLGRVSRIDVSTHERLASIRLPAPPLALAAGPDAIWVVLERGDLLWRIDPRDNVAVGAVRIPGGAIDVAVGEGSVWALGGDGDVTRIDPRTNAITGRASAGREGAIAVGHGVVWIATH